MMPRYTRYALYFFVVVVGLIISVLVVVGKGQIPGGRDSNQNLSEPSSQDGAFFVPPSSEGKEVLISGRLTVASGAYGDVGARYRLTDESGDIVVYLVSESHDLNLPIGLDVEVEGRILGQKVQNVDLVKVETIRLK